MKHSFLLRTLGIGLLLAHSGAQAQNAKPQPAAKQSPFLHTLHYDDISFRGGGDGADECANATVLTVGATCTTIAGSAVGATESQAPILCNGFTSGTALDVWFQFTATAASTTITATGVDDYDVVMEVFSGDCGSLTALGCADATFPPGGLVETFVAATTVGQTYRVRVYSYTPPANVSTAFTICAFSPGGGGTPANDACTGATVESLAVPGTVTVSGDNTGATVDAPTTFALVWHTFTIASCANLDINYCVPGSEFDDFLVNLVVNCPDFITGFLTGTVSVDNCTLSFANLPAGTYYLPVLVDGAVTPVGAYSVQLTTTACGGGPGPANDDCANATTIGVNATCVATTGTTQDATQSLAPATCSTFTASAANDVWYSFTATAASTTIEVTGDGDATTGMDPVLEAFSGTCAALVSLGCVDATVRGGTESLVVPTTVGATYYYRIYYWPYAAPQTVFGFTTCVIAAGGGTPPPNDECGSVTPVALAVGGSVDFNGDNTNATGTNDAAPGSTLDPLDPTVWHAFTTTECANVTVSYCNTDPAFANVWIFLSPSCPVADDYVLGGFDLDVCPDNVVVTYLNLPAGTWYLPVLMEIGTAVGPYSITVSATACVPVVGYCIPISANGPDEGDYVSNVALGAINNATTFDVGVTYQDYTAQSTTLVQGLDYSITVASGEFEPNMLAAWIDFNADEVFEVSEKLGEVLTDSPLQSATFNFTVPFNAAVGATRLRVRCVYPQTGQPNPADPCYDYSWGETEDYSVLIDLGTSVGEQVGAAWSVFPNPNDGNMTISYQGPTGTASIEMVDVAGRIVFAEQRALTQGSMVSLNLSDRMAGGTYFLRFAFPGGLTDQLRIVVR
ncbi:MAG: T9SS type A sorting domain-containing protein [Flavobacteriales bacterium]|nr:T9SS type A sorting domain-containing protein [Flavobacteriales bacterium]